MFMYKKKLYFSLPEAVERTSYSYKTVYEYVRTGKISAEQICGGYAISETGMAALMQMDKRRQYQTATLKKERTETEREATKRQNERRKKWRESTTVRFSGERDKAAIKEARRIAEVTGKTLKETVTDLLIYAINDYKHDITQIKRAENKKNKILAALSAPLTGATS